MTHRLFRADRHVADQHLRGGLLQHRGDIDGIDIGRAERLVVGILRHMRRHAVENRRHPDVDARNRQGFLKHHRAVGLGEDRPFQGLTDLAPVDVEGGHDLDVAGAPTADVGMHEPGGIHAPVGPVIFDPLYQRTRTVADSCNRHPYSFHEPVSPFQKTPPLGVAGIRFRLAVFPAQGNVFRFHANITRGNRVPCGNGNTPTTAVAAASMRHAGRIETSKLVRDFVSLPS